MSVQAALKALADFIRGHRAADNMDPRLRDAMAREMGLSQQDFDDLARDVRGGRDLHDMLQSLKIDEARVQAAGAALMAQLALTCAHCTEIGTCRRHLRAGTAAAHFEEYCPNWDTLKTLKP